MAVQILFSYFVLLIVFIIHFLNIEQYTLLRYIIKKTDYIQLYAYMVVHAKINKYWLVYHNYKTNLLKFYLTAYSRLATQGFNVWVMK